MFYDIALKSNLFDTKNNATPTLQRGSTATIIDNEGNVIDIAINEAGFEGVRRLSEGNYSELDVIGNPIPDYKKKGVKIEKQGVNLFVNPGVPATQTIGVLNATEHSISVKGGGNIVLSGAGTGTVSEGNPITITTSSTSLTCTVNGSLNLVQVEQGAFSTSFIKDGARSADELKYQLNSGKFPRDFTLLMEVTPIADGADYEYSEIVLVNTEDSRGTANQVTTKHDSVYSFTVDANGYVFGIPKTVFEKNVRTKLAFGLKQQGSNIMAVIVKDGVVELDVTVPGTLDHSNTGIFQVGGDGTNTFSANYRMLKGWSDLLGDAKILNELLETRITSSGDERITSDGSTRVFF